MMSDLKKDTNLGNKEPKQMEPEHKESKAERCEKTAPVEKKSNEKGDKKVEQAMWLSWGG